MNPQQSILWVAALTCLCCTSIVVPAQEIEDPVDLPPLKIVDDAPGLRNFDGYEDYLFLQEALFFPRGGKDKKETVRLTFDLAQDLPKGTVISFTLEHWGLDYVSVDFKFNGDSRQDIVYDWIPEQGLAAGDYYLRSRVHLDKQPADVRRAITDMSDRFPPKVQPWPFLYMTDELRITVPETSDPAEQRELWKSYLGFMDRLVDNMNEFVTKMDIIRDGKEFVAEEKLELKEFEEYITSWRKKQGELQERIANFEVDQPRLFYQSRSAFLNLRRLGRMVSKRARVLQNAITTQYGEDPITARGHDGFDDRYPYRIDESRLQRQYDGILRMIDYPGPDEASGANASPLDGESNEASPPPLKRPPPLKLQPPE